MYGNSTKTDPKIIRLASAGINHVQDVRFDRSELDVILKLYSRMVAANEWRDYAIGHGKDSAVFSIFRRSNDAPLYNVVKQPALAQRQGAYSVTTSTGIVLKRGKSLEIALKVLEQKLRII